MILEPGVHPGWAHMAITQVGYLVTKGGVVESDFLVCIELKPPQLIGAVLIGNMNCDTLDGICLGRKTCAGHTPWVGGGWHGAASQLWTAWVGA